MTPFCQRFPRGPSGVPAQRNGIAHGAGYRVPGPLGIGSGLVDDSTGGRPVAAPTALGEYLGATFALGSNTYRLRPARAAWSANSYEEPVQREEARTIIEELVLQRAADLALVSLLKGAIARLSSLDPHPLVLVKLRPRGFAGGAPESPTTYLQPRPKPLPEPSPSLPTPVEKPVMSAEVAAAQAATLSKAAESGVPFCEECARIAAQRLVAATT